MEAPAKQQIVEKVKAANNILVTVSKNPSVDQLAAAIGLTLLLNKMDKHATAVYSGKTPSTIEFLQPEKTLEVNTDSLQDFIISLDKSKADKLRYKVEDQFVRIFITPYRTSLSEKDLVFSQGDFNVDVIIALGVTDRSQLDAAITAHGRILHDAAIISVVAGQGKATDLGQINWQEPASSSLCEMLVSISEAFGGGLIDNQIATAFMTGIVAETDRFSNQRTSPKVMTMSAQLMAAGANQQLIVKELEPPPPPPLPPPKPPAVPAKPAKPPLKEVSKPKPAPPPKPKPVLPPAKPEAELDRKDGVLSVAHDKGEADSGEVELNPAEIKIDEKGNLITKDRKQDGGNDDNANDESMPPSTPPPPGPPPVSPPPPAAPPPPPAPPPIPSAPGPLPTDLPPPAKQTAQTESAASPHAMPHLMSLQAGLPPLGQPAPVSASTPPTSESLPATAGLPSTAETPAETPSHALMDPRQSQGNGAAFSADTNGGWNDAYNTVPFDPLSTGGSGFTGLMQRHENQVGSAQPTASSAPIPPPAAPVPPPVGPPHPASQDVSITPPAPPNLPPPLPLSQAAIPPIV